jgi:hypothetical protein
VALRAKGGHNVEKIHKGSDMSVVRDRLSKQFIANVLAVGFLLESSVVNAQVPSADFLISAGRVGPIEIGMSVDEVFQRVGREHVRLIDLFKEGMFSPAVQVEMPGGSVAPAIVADIREWPCPGFAVWGIDVRDPKFRTAEGLGVGSTLGELRRLHAVELSHAEGEFAIVAALKMSFALNSRGGADSVRVTDVWVWPDPVAVHQRRCPDRAPR